MGNETPSTALTTPSSVKKWVRRFRMSSRTSPLGFPMKSRQFISLRSSLQSRVHRVAKSVADDVEDGHRQEDRKPREDGEPPLLIIGSRDAQDGTPARR